MSGRQYRVVAFTVVLVLALSGVAVTASAGSNAALTTGDISVAEPPDSPTTNNTTVADEPFRYITEPKLFEVSTSHDGEPSVDEPTTVTLTLTAITDASEVTVTLPDYHFFGGDNETVALGGVTEGETYTVSMAVTPTAQLDRNLRFEMAGTTAEGRQVEHVSHRLSLLDATGGATPALQIDRATPDQIGDTTVDSLGERNASGGAQSGSATATGRVTGCAVYTDGNGNLEAAERFRVDVYDEDKLKRNHLGSGRTDANGCFNIAVSDPSKADWGKNNHADVYVVVSADTPAAKVTDKNNNQIRMRAPSGTLSLADGGSVRVYPGGAITPTTQNEGYQAADWALEAYEFVQRKTGYTRSQVDVHYPETDWPSYSAGSDTMTLPDTSNQGWGRGTTYHEYGHALMHGMYGYDTDNWPNRFPNGESYGGHFILSETNPGYAFVEGWAEFLEAAVTYERTGNYVFQGQGGPGQGIEDNEWFNLSVSSKTDDDGVTPGADKGDMDGNSVEGSLASIWFDIYDGGPNDTDDGIDFPASRLGAVGFEEVFDTIRDNNVVDMRGFHRNWDDGFDEELAEIYYRYGILVPDSFENDNTFANATPIGEGTLNGTLGSGVDHFEVTVPQMVDMTADLRRTYSASGADIRLELYDQNQNRIAVSDVSQDFETVDFPTPTAGAETYYLRVSVASGTAAYGLNLTSEFVDDSYEDNDERSDAVDIPEGVTSLRMAADRKDYFEFDLDDEEILNVSTDRGQGNLDNLGGVDLLRLKLFDDSGTQVYATGVGGQINYTAPENGEYTLLVTRSGGDGLAFPYDLNVTMTDPRNDIYEPNDARSSATAQYLDPIEGRIVYGEDDWYQVRAPAGAELNVSMAQNDEETVRFRVYPPNSFRTGVYFDGTSAVIQDTDAGYYYVEVYTSYDETARYDLDIELDENPDVDPGPDKYESNDDFASATQVPRYFESGSLSKIDTDDDFYAVDLDAGNELTVNITYNSSYGNLGTTLYGPSQNPLNDQGLDDDKQVTVQDTGTYYVEVSGVTDQDVPYALTIEGNDQYESNDQRDAATSWPLVFLGFDSGYALVEEISAIMAGGEDDYYAVGLTEGNRLSVAVTPTSQDTTVPSSEAWLYASVLDSQGRQLTQSFINADATLTAPANDTYYIRVHPWLEAGYTVDYDLSLQASDGLDPSKNDGFDNATIYVGADSQRTFELNDSNPEDYYSVYLKDDTALEADVGFSGTSDIDIDIYGPDRGKLTQTQSGPLNSVNLSADVIAPTDGYYYVRVHGATSATPYEISLDTVGEDQYELNDSPETAPVLEDGTYSARLFEGDTFTFGNEPAQRNEPDYYAVSVPGETFLNVSVSYDYESVSNSTIEDGSDLDVHLIGGLFGSTIASDTSIGPNPSVSSYSFFPGTYYVKVNATGLDTVTPYELNISTVSPDTIDIGPEADGIEQFVNTAPTVAATSLSEATNQPLQLSTGTNVSYGFQLLAGGVVNITSTGTGNVDLGLYDSSGRLLRVAEGTTANETIRFETLRNDTYYLQATGAGDFGADFQIDVTRSRPTNDRFEDNDNRRSATLLSPGSYEGLTLDTAEQDYYEMELTAGQQLTVGPDFEHLDGLFEVSVYGPGESLLATASASDLSSPLTTTVEASGTHYIVVNSIDSPAVDYGLDVGVVTPENDRFEANDDESTATDIEPGSYDGLEIALGDTDVFAVELAKHERLDVETTFDHADGDLDLTVSGLGGEQRVQSFTDSNNESASLRAQASGVYYITVTGKGSMTAEYGLAVDRTAAPENDRFENNDDNETATVIEPGTYEDLQIVGGELDNFAIQLTEGEPLNASISFSQSLGDLDLKLVGPNDQFAGSLSATDDEAAGLVAASSGTYYVQVVGYQGSSAPYTLTVENGSAAEAPTLPGNDEPASNLDDDAQLEDVDGDGTGSIFDAISLYNNRNSDAVTNNPDLFDFTGDDRVDLFDAIELYNELRG